MRRLTLLTLAAAMLAIGQATWNNPGAQAPIFNTLRSGIGAPSSLIGNNGDFYIDATPGAQTLYGPKSANGWPTGVSMTGGGGGVSSQLVSKSSAYTLTLADGTIVCDTRNNAVVLSLDTVPVNSEPHRIKQFGKHSCTILGNTSTIDGAAQISLQSESGASIDVQYDGQTSGANGWRIL